MRTAGLARADPEAFLQVGLLTSGRAVLRQDGREAALEPGRFAVYETDRPFHWHFPGSWTLLVWTWPRHLVDLGVDAARASTARVLGHDRLGRLVGHALAETALAPPDLADGGARRLAGEMAALVGATLGEQLRRDEMLRAPVAADLRRRIDSYILEHLDDPALTVDGIARAHFVSIRGLHRAFADVDMTVGRLIRAHRLAEARHRLLDPRRADQSISDIATGCGFSDLPAFSRNFKAEYHETPSTYRRRSASADSGPG